MTVLIILPQAGYCGQAGAIERARNNLAEALELFFEHASDSEIQERLHNEK